MNTTAKGKRSVEKVIAYLKLQGYHPRIVEKSTRHVPEHICPITGELKKERDLYGLWDILAIHPARKPLFVQVKTNSKAPDKPFLEFMKKFPYSDYAQAIVYAGRTKLLKGIIWIDYTNGTRKDMRK